MRKRIILSLAAIAAIALGVAGFSAFEAHVINVTAKIENAMAVDTNEIDWGTVFPQESFETEIGLALSQSFLDEDRVDDVEYILRQKPKCYNAASGEFAQVSHEAGVYFCEDPGFELLPILCPFLSKSEISDDGLVAENDGPALLPFHGPAMDWDLDDTLTYEIAGRMAKSEEDYTDTWLIDFQVPCFEGHCAQDWAAFVASHNDSVNPDDYILPIELEHELFGCDLWFEVGGISLPPDIVCGDGVMEGDEECDDGAANGTPCDPPYDGSCSYCDYDCTLVELFDGFCGDGEINGPEECEADADCEPSEVCTDCICVYIEECGNDIIDSGETCELPDTTDNSYCSQSTSECAGPKLQTRDGFGDCDSVCGCVEDPFENPVCSIAVCGAECESDADCNDGIPESTDTCNLDTCQCEFGPYCGDGITNGTEQCDDGNSSNEDDCLNDCTANVCGDGFLNVGVEECDDGNSIDDDFCSNSCVENALLTVYKVMNNINGGNNVESDFQLTVDGINVNNGESNVFSEGTHFVSEIGVSGYDATYSGDCDTDGNVALVKGVSKSCTITNTDIKPNITLYKVVINDDGGTAVPSSFTMRIDGVIVPTGSSKSVTSNSPHTITEDAFSGYADLGISGDPECPSVLGGSATLDEGKAIECTITNDDDAG